MTPLFKTQATANGGREGRTRSADGHLDVKLSMPKELGGPGGDGTNPEQLFAAGYAACFESALRLVARTRKIALKDVFITAEVTLNKTDDGKFQLSVGLSGRFPEMAKEEGKALMEGAHGICPYSLATRGNIEVTLDVQE